MKTRPFGIEAFDLVHQRPALIGQRSLEIAVGHDGKDTNELCRLGYSEGDFLAELALDNTSLALYVTFQLLIMHRARADEDVFRAIADPTRRAILDRLRAGPARAGALASDFQLSRPAVSKHIRVLRQARLVTHQRAGRERVYRLDPVPLQRVAGWIEGYRAFWQTSFSNLKRYLEGK